MEFLFDHDYHIHTYLSKCSSDPEQNPANILKFAEESGIREICLTDHCWDKAVPGASNWYSPQDVAHVSEKLPLPSSDKVRVLFGCETEYCGGEKLALSKEHFGTFDFIIIPPNHFHMKGLVRDASVVEPQDVAALFCRRLNELTFLSLPWEKIGIAHLLCPLIYRDGDRREVFARVEEDQLRRAFSFFAEHGAGIELNDGDFTDEWSLSDGLEIFRLAKSEGCLFYRGSDAHHFSGLRVHDGAVKAASLLGLTAADQYRVPQ